MRLPRWSWIGVNPASLTLVVIVLAVALYVWSAPILDLIELKTSRLFCGA